MIKRLGLGLLVFGALAVAFLASAGTARADITNGNFTMGVGPDGEVFNYGPYIGFLAHCRRL